MTTEIQYKKNNLSKKRMDKQECQEKETLQRRHKKHKEAASIFETKMPSTLVNSENEIAAGFEEKSEMWEIHIRDLSRYFELLE